MYERFRGVTTLVTPGTTECNGEPDSPCLRFAGASKDGRRVFFVTTDSLVPADTDTLNDLYVAIVPSHACRAHKPGKHPKKCRL